ncbi:MAG TPA: hypothetical protein DDX71_00625 [Ruminococcus sp.]|nr:hypothetical protein [Ruminococcus sp.]
MKIRNAALGIAALCAFAAAHYHDKIHIEFDTPAPAEFVRRAEEFTRDAADFLRACQESAAADESSTEIRNIAPDNYYRIRRDWDDPASQIGAYADYEIAVRCCPAGYTVYDPEGTPLCTPQPEN